MPPENGGATATTEAARTNTLKQPPTNRSHRPVSLGSSYREPGTHSGGDANSAPFDGANIYRARGWQGTIPLPARSKGEPPKGWTGHGTPDPDNDQIRLWARDPYWRGANLGLRLPGDVVGVDVDHYDDKPGGRTLTTLEATWGELPATYISTSRSDGVSGIRFYRVPIGLKWPGTPGPGIEIIQRTHRYAVVWPSVHPEGRTYQWLTPDGRTAAVPPRVTDLPALPRTWVMGLTGGVTQAEQPHVPAASTTTVRDYLANAPQGTPCRYVQRLVGRITLALTSGGSRHDAVSSGDMLLLIRAADWGHRGVPSAVVTIRRVFLAVANDRGPGEAEAEFARSIAGAVAKVQANPARRQGRGCCGGEPA